jgi:alcohol dehydrogenase class IV
VRFDYAAPPRILFGPGSIRDLPTIVAEYGSRALLVTGANPDRCSRAAQAMMDAGIETSLFGVEGEPTVDAARWGARAARGAANVVIGFGGGSAIDAAKAIAALAANDGDVLDYLEAVGQGKPLERAPLPFIAVPTTAGTGSEVTRNAVLGSPEHRVKASLRSRSMIARAAVIDPELTLGLPPAMTANTGMDALTQCIEPYVSARANAIADLFCVEGIHRIVGSLERAFHDGSQCEARESMCLGALMGGLALSNAGLGVVHGFAAPIGGMFDAPHGAVCAAVLPHGMAANIRALRERAPDSAALQRYREIARMLTGNVDATPEDGAAWADDLCRRLRIPPLRTYRVTAAHVAELVNKAAQASSMKANPIVLTTEELTRVLESAF